MKRLFFLLLLLSVGYLSGRAALRINEIMQSNVDCIYTPDTHEYPDSWIELWNDGSTAVNLSSYSLSLTGKAAEAYALPGQTVNPGEHVLIYCDKEGQGRHTSFRLETDKNGAIYLHHNGQVTDSLVRIPAQPAPNIAYGRRTDGSTQVGFLSLPTPGATNCGHITSVLLPEPLFSQPGKVITHNVNPLVRISMPTGLPTGTFMRYTIDCSEPMPDHGTRVDTAISLTLPAGATVVKARLFHDSCLSRPATTQTYVMLGRTMNLPVVSITTDSLNLYDYQRGIYVEGAGPSGSYNYQQNWRRPFTFEFFPSADSPAALQQRCEGRIQGGASRGCALKSLALYTHKRFGAKQFKYEFFPDQRPGDQKFKSLILRNAGNDFDYLYMRDAIIQRAMAAGADIDWQAWRPTILYLNGEYKGIINIRERANEYNVMTHYDGLEDIDLVEGWWGAKEGTSDNWWQFVSFYNQAGHTWDEFEQWIDCSEFLNIMLMNLYFDNRDFPSNNIVFWRPRVATPTRPARWRVIAKDTDFGLGIYYQQPSSNTLYWLYHPGSDPDHNWGNTAETTLLFRRLMEDTVGQRVFIDRAAVYVGDFLKPERVREIWDPMYNMIHPEWSIHRPMYNQWWPNYQDELNWARSWLSSRPDYFLEHVREHFGLGELASVDINTFLTDTAGLTIVFNGIPLTSAKWNGSFFRNRTITLSATRNADDGLVVTGWQLGKKIGKRINIIAEYPGAEITALIPDDADGLYLQAVIGTPDALEHVDATSSCRTTKVLENNKVIILRDGMRYDLLGRRR